jgi:hypothetical protein
VSAAEKPVEDSEDNAEGHDDEKEDEGEDLDQSIHPRRFLVLGGHGI